MAEVIFERMPIYFSIYKHVNKVGQ